MVILQENNNNFWILKPKLCENLRDFGLFGLEYLPRKTSKSKMEFFFNLNFYKENLKSLNIWGRFGGG